MDMTGEYRITAPRERVWAALNDPDILKQCIPGCQEIEKTGADRFKAKIVAKVGPVQATFSGNVTLSDLDPPRSYKIGGEGSGGAAGFARGGAEVGLEEDGNETILRYKVHANVGGKLAQIGSRLIDSTAKKFSDEFFGKFAAVVGAPVETAPEAPAATVSAPPPPQPKVGLPPTVWIGGIVLLIIIILIIFAG